MENKHNFMETESITKLLIKFSIPAIVGMFVNALYNVVDRIYIGNDRELSFVISFNNSFSCIFLYYRAFRSTASI